ncbi:SLC37A3 [Cervus elaphus hippelaphus]|uniref:SLC37A3 n=1 Tax=Cervus elaphus hippelaphus TaxID=46360 RepID=A0A212CKF3_CEREH|nr:SLC37A3 [Cervus elaphus hippelaphus]
MVAAGGCGAAGQAGCRSFPPRWAWLLGAQVLRSLARPARTAAERGEGIGGPPGRAWPPASAAALVQIWSSNHLFPSAEEATLFLGTLDTIFLFSYAVGLFVSGIVGDRLNLRWVLSFGMCSSALVVFVFGTLTEWLHFYNKGLYCSLWIVNGLLQSTGWPCVVAVMGNWFGKAGRGVVFGLWSACASVGNILGACLASSVLQYGYEKNNSVKYLSVVKYRLYRQNVQVKPQKQIDTEENFEEDSHRPLINGAENEDEAEPNYSIQEGNTVTQVKAISFFQACCLPGVIALRELMLANR